LKRGAVYQQWLKPIDNIIWRVKEGVVGLVTGLCKSNKKEITPTITQQAEASSRVKEGCDDGAMSRW
jgi:hypothetical protein